MSENHHLVKRDILILVALTLVAILTHLYFIARYEFRWLDWDTATVTRSIDALQNEGTLDSSHPYAWGFAYQAIVDTISLLTGISPAHLQQTIIPVTFGILPVILAIAVYRSFVHNRWNWIVATLLVLVLPEFILDTSRGTHEKATIALMLTVLLVSSWNLNPHRSIRMKRSLGGFVCLLVVMPSLIFYNCFFAISFIIVMSISLYACSRIGGIRVPGHLGVFILYGIALWAGFVSFYEPASNFFSTADTYWDRLMLILSGSDTSDPYQGIERSWSSNSLWILSNLVAFFLILSSSMQLLRFIRRGNGDKSNPAMYFYIGASILMACYIGLDFVGGSSLSNLQIRWLPFWGLFAAPIASLWLRDTVPHLRWRVSRKKLSAVGIAAFMIVTPLSLMRSTLDPSMTNYWIFYDASEEHAIDWIEELCDGDCWGGPHYRIGSLHVFKYGYHQRDNLSFITADDPWNLDFALDSVTTDAHWERMKIDKLDFRTWNRVADFGEASVVSRF